MFLRGKTMLLLALCGGALVFTSCADGFNSDERFEPITKNATLVSPTADVITITPSADGTHMTIAWPVVSGAGGYKLSVTDVTGDEPVAVVNDSIIDGCSCYIEREEDRSYMLSLLTLGNPKQNNKEAETATEKAFSSFATSFATIPAGADLAKYFEENPVPTDLSSEDMIFDLEAGATYYLNGTVDFKGQRATLRTASTNRAIIIYGETAHLRTSAGVTIKNLIIDGGAMTSDKAAVLEFSPEPIEAIKGIQIAGDKESQYYDIQDPVTFRNCEMKALPGYVLYDNGKAYSLANLIVENCLIHCKTSGSASVTSNALFNNYGAGVRNLSCTNTTMWSSETAKPKYIFRYINSFRPDRAGVTEGSVKVSNCTFYNVFEQGGNYDNWKSSGNGKVWYTLTNNIFVNCGTQIPRFFCAKSAQPDYFTFGYNTYLKDGEFDESSNVTSYDITGTYLLTDPGFADPAHGDFTLSTSSDQYKNKTGDPRWIKE